MKISEYICDKGAAIGIGLLAGLASGRIPRVHGNRTAYRSGCGSDLFDGILWNTGI